MVGIRVTEMARETSISQRKGSGRNNGSGLLGVPPLSGLSGLEAGNGGSETVFAASFYKLRLEGLDFNFNFFGHILVLHGGRLKNILEILSWFDFTSYLLESVKWLQIIRKILEISQ